MAFALLLVNQAERPCTCLLRLLCGQVEYQHSPGGIGNLYRAPDESNDRQGTLPQRQQYVAQYEVQYIEQIQADSPTDSH